MTFRGPVFTKRELFVYPDSSIAESSNTSLLLPNVNVPPNATIWVIPVGPQRSIDLLTDINPGIGVLLSQDNIFHRTFDYPNPRGSVHAVQTFTASFPLELIGKDNLLIRQLDWPNPVLAIVRRQDWILSSFNAPVQVFVPNPFASNNQILPNQFIINRPDYQQSSFEPLLQSSVLPPQSHTNWDWPNPILGRDFYSRQDWTYAKSQFFVLEPQAPNDFPNPVAWNIVRYQDWIYSAQVSEIEAPFYQTDQPNPVLGIIRRQDWLYSSQIPELIAIGPAFIQVDWPNPVVNIVRRQDWTFSTNPYVLLPPFYLTDWLNPVRSILRYQDWQLAAQIPTTVIPPNLGYVHQYDWPNPVLAIQSRQDFATLNISTHAAAVVQPHIYYRHFFSGMGGMGGFNEF